MKWKVVHIYDDEKGNPTCWVCYFARGCRFVYIKQFFNVYAVYDSSYDSLLDYLFIATSLSDAKRYVYKNRVRFNL